MNNEQRKEKMAYHTKIFNWFREHGGTRPMAAAGVQVLTIGEWKKNPIEGMETGHYPLAVQGWKTDTTVSVYGVELLNPTLEELDQLYSHLGLAQPPDWYGELHRIAELDLNENDRAFVQDVFDSYDGREWHITDNEKERLVEIGRRHPDE